MGIPNKRLNEGDIFVDYDLEKVKFRWDSHVKKFYRKFAGDQKEIEVPSSNDLLTNALLYGEEIDQSSYGNSKKSKFAKAGDADDCGHERSGSRKAGKFDKGNTCHTGTGVESTGPKHSKKDLAKKATEFLSNLISSEANLPRDKKGQTDRERKGKPKKLSEKAQRAQSNQNKTSREEQTYAKNNEHAFAARLGGQSYADNGPVDVELKIKGKNHGIELKTLTHGKNDKLTMKGEALARKEKYKKEGNELHTVALDHRHKFAGGKNKHLHSGHEMWYRRGAGSFRVKSMFKVKDEKHLKQLMSMPADQLPPGAR